MAKETVRKDKKKNTTKTTKTKKASSQKSIGKKIMTMSIVLVALAAILVGALSITVSSLALKGVVNDQMSSLAVQVADNILVNTDVKLNYLEGLAGNQVVYGMASNQILQKNNLMEIADQKGFLELGYVDSDGATMLPDKKGFADVSQELYFNISSQGGSFVTTPYMDEALGQLVILFSVPVYKSGDSLSGEIVGVLFGKVDGYYLSEITDSVKLGDTGMAYMVDSEGVIISHVERERVLNKENAIVDLADVPGFESLISMLQVVVGNESGCTTYSYNGDLKYVGYATVDKCNWHVLVSQDQSVLFAGSQQAIIVSVIAMLVVVIMGAIVSIGFAKRITGPIKKLNSVNEALSKGDLAVKVEADKSKKKDEIGQMTSSTDQFVEKLKAVIGNTKASVEGMNGIAEQLKELAIQSNEAAESVGEAVNEISAGSVSQANDMETAAVEVGNLGDAVDKIREDIEVLLQIAEATKDAEKESNSALQDLIISNNKTTTSVHEIADQISETNNASIRIGEAAKLITEIASQTNLLSLNASIEAARAGEAGRGFAVVASEIQALSDQSNSAANTIQRIIDELTNGSKKSLEKMNETLMLVEEQQKKLRTTQESSEIVSDNVDRISESVKDIDKSTETCASVKETVNSIVMNLSAISEENAASAEMTNAAMQELGVNIGIISNSAEELSSMSDELSGEMDFWKI